LPTIYHWLKAAGISYYSDILQCSNFSGAGPVRVGSRQGLSPYGNYDMAGNVKEWCWNQAGDLHYILGAAYNEPTYMFSDYDAQSPFARSSTFGFRCAKYTAPPSGAVLAPIKALSRDYAKEKPASDEVFRVYRALFSYDRTDLKSAIEATDESSPYWRREKITFDAAYGGERVIAILFLPRNASPPFQTVVYYPGSSAFMVKGSSNSINGSNLEFVMRSGRALIYPIYKGSYERGSGVAPRPTTANAWRGMFISSSMDLGRSLDYLETRADIDRTKLAYYGLSFGGIIGPVLTAVDGRFQAGVLEGGGLFLEAVSAETDPFNFAARAKEPVLMLNGRFDFTMPVATSQLPLFRLLGAPEKDKRHVLFDAGHAVPRTPKIKEILDWLDRYLGPVKLQPVPGKATP
jgi:cephalosporin-C deacetylase-like acetyl esterase